MGVRVKWCDRTLIMGPYFTVCTTEELFRRELRRIGIKEHLEFIAPDMHARCYHLACSGKRCSIVCMPHYPDRDPTQVVALLVHEAVHIWQEYKEFIGEHSPGKETEAYAIQNISQELIREYSRQINL